MKTLAVIGGGASGLAAAIAAGDVVRRDGRDLRITIYEDDERVGRSILVTGNGRCNFSNARICSAEYYNAEFVADVFAALGRHYADGGGQHGADGGVVASAPSGAAGADACEQLVAKFFQSLGLAWREEDDGRRYPLANKASVVVDVLRSAARRLGVREALGNGVAAVERPRADGKPFTLRMADGTFERADAVVVSCGGRALGALEVEGLRALRARPVLGPLKVAAADVPFARELDNIRVKASVSLLRKSGGSFAPVATEAGELMFRKYGVSGICVFNLSRLAWPGDRLVVDLLQLRCGQTPEEFMLARRSDLMKRFGAELTCADLLRGLVLPRVADALFKRTGIDEAFPAGCGVTAQLADALSNIELEVAGIGDADVCQVRRGGFDVAQFDPATLEAREASGLFATGEALDVDGPCGGYNLHWAWASGLLAGGAAAEALL